jgi:ABC-type multidrug transport system fused ATPase/permease subunit
VGLVSANPASLAAAPADARPSVASWTTIRRLIARFRPYPVRTAGALALQLLRAALDLAAPFLLGVTIASLKGLEGLGGPLPSRFVDSVLLLAAALVLRLVVLYAAAVACASLAQDVENRLRTDLFTKVLRLPFAWHDENRSGKTIARSLGDMEKAKAFFREAAFGYVELSLLVVGVVALSFVLHWSYGLVAAVGFLGALTATALVGARIARIDRNVSDRYESVTTQVQENVAGARVVRAFGQEPAEVDRFGGRLSTFSAAWKVEERFWTSALPLVNHAMFLVVPAALVVGALRIAEEPGPERLGEVLAAIFYLRTVRERVRPFTRLVLLGQRAVASASRVFEVLDAPDALREPSAHRRLPAKGGDLVVEDVAFRHPAGRQVLRGVSLHVPPGGSLGILGRTGAGKTSLVQLLPRFYDPERGRILLDGVDLRDLEPGDLAQAVGLVFQEPFLFSATVAENVAYGRPDASRARIEEACRLAAAHEFVVRLPKGYDTIIGERGVSLSGGQRQRLTIARSLVPDPRVLVFDDATARVDALTEKDLFRGIRAAARGRTTLVISQRVTSVAWCDRVAIVEDGAVSAIGDHDELASSSALYREIHEHQALERVPS